MQGTISLHVPTSTSTSTPVSMYAYTRNGVGLTSKAHACVISAGQMAALPGSSALSTPGSWSKSLEMRGFDRSWSLLRGVTSPPRQREVTKVLDPGLLMLRPSRIVVPRCPAPGHLSAKGCQKHTAPVRSHRVSRAGDSRRVSSRCVHRARAEVRPGGAEGSDGRGEDGSAEP